METIDVAFYYDNNMFKSYYVVWKLFIFLFRIYRNKNSLNRTMQYGNYIYRGREEAFRIV